MTVAPVVLLGDEEDADGLLMPISKDFLPCLTAIWNDLDIVLNTCRKSNGTTCPERFLVVSGVLTRQRLSSFVDWLAVFKGLANEANTARKPEITLPELLIYIRDNEENLSLPHLQMIPAYDSPIPNNGIEVDGENNPFLSDLEALEIPEIAPFIGKLEISVGDIWDNGGGSSDRFYLVTCVHLGYGVSLYHWETQGGENVLVQDVYESVEERTDHNLCNTLTPPLPVGYSRSGGKYLVSCCPENSVGSISFNNQSLPNIIFRQSISVVRNCDNAVENPYKWRRIGSKQVETWNWLAKEGNVFSRVISDEFEEKHADSDFWYNVSMGGVNTSVAIYGKPLKEMFAGVSEGLPVGAPPVLLGGFGFMPVLFGGVAVGFIGSEVSSLVANIRTNFRRE